MDDLALQRLMEKTRDGCYEQVQLFYKSMPNTDPFMKEDVDNVFKYVYNYYMFSTPNINKNQYSLLLINTKTRVVDFIERTQRSSFLEMTPIDILVSIFGPEQVDKAIEKYGQTNPITDIILQEENTPELKPISTTTLEEVDGGSRSRTRKTNKNLKKNFKKSKKSKKSRKSKKSKKSRKSKKNYKK